jgi:transcriptional regulator with XRE-family HTH domain
VSDKEGSYNDGWVRAIRAEMGAQGVNQRQLAQTMGVHFATVNGYLTANLSVRTVMNLDVVESIAAALRVNVDALAVAARERRASARRAQLIDPETQTVTPLEGGSFTSDPPEFAHDVSDLGGTGLTAAREDELRRLGLLADEPEGKLQAPGLNG